MATATCPSINKALKSASCGSKAALQLRFRVSLLNSNARLDNNYVTVPVVHTQTHMRNGQPTQQLIKGKVTAVHAMKVQGGVQV
jgi:cellobiose-specific phosphotransferase system component IIA